jgi:histidinol-phosphate aminotransferase
MADHTLLVRPNVRKLHAYVPGEQPKIPGLVKLNTNENPYGPSPKVLSRLREAIGDRLRLYPNPTAERLRNKLARLHHCGPENIVVGNGSDELLALATRAFVEPLSALTRYGLQSASAAATLRKPARRAEKAKPTESGSLSPSPYTVQYFEPSYSLYPVLADIHGAWARPIALRPDFSLPSPEELQARHWDFSAALTYLTTPHAPSGRGYPRHELDELCRQHRGVVVLDEAYVEFGKEDALPLALKHPHVLVSRTFSKAYSLCALRVGYMVGNPELIIALDKVRDSYNVNSLGQAAAEATLDSLPYYRRNFERVIRSRERTSEALGALGFSVFPSQTNFILVKPPRFPAEAWLPKLRDKRVLIRWFNAPAVRDYLRISIGTELEMEKLLKAVRSVLSGRRSRA